MADPRMQGLDGKEYPIKMVSNPKDNCSSYHREAVELINKVYPNATLLEEVSAKIKKGKTLYLDIYLPTLNVVVEVDGEQHSKRVEFFYKDRQAFLRAQYRDQQKKEWCELNDIKFVRFDYSRRGDWEEILRGAIE